MSDKHIGNVRVEGDNPFGHNCKLVVGDTIIPFYSLDIHIAAAEYVTITAKVPAERIDVVALERDTEIKVIKHGAAES